MNIRKYIRENFELVDKKWVEDNEIVLGDYYLATTKHDVYNIPYKLIPADSVGVFLKNKEENKAEITVYCIDEDLYEVVFEDTSEKPVKEEIFKAGPYTTRELYDFLNILFLDYSVVEPRRIKEKMNKFGITESIQDDINVGWVLIVEGINHLVFDSCYDKLERNMNKIQQIQQSQVKLKRIKELLLDIQGRLIDEQYDKYNDKVDKFLGIGLYKNKPTNENFDFFTQKEEIQEETHKDIENDVKRIIQNCCKGKSREILPKKWALDRNEVVLVFWFNYFENKKVMNLCNKIEQALYDELGIGISVCADTTAKLNWHNI